MFDKQNIIIPYLFESYQISIQSQIKVTIIFGQHLFTVSLHLFIMRGQNQSRAQKNWAKLRSIIKSGKHSVKQRKNNWQLFQKHQIEQVQSIITQYSWKNVKIKQISPRPTINQLMHFQSQIDATGKWVWEAEQIAAYYLLNTSQQYINLKECKQSTSHSAVSVLQLGAGSSGLAGIALKLLCQKLQPKIPLFLQLTDGQHQNIPFLEQNLRINGISSEEGRAFVMQWGDQEALINVSRSSSRKYFDLIIACDCLFFQDFHKELLLTFNSYLALEGVILLFNPARGNSMKRFLQLALASGLQHTTIHLNDQKYQAELARIRQTQNFQEDRDVPFIIQLRRHFPNI